MAPAPILVTGATGYVGGRLVPALLERGAAVRCLARTPAKLRDARWFDSVEVVQGSVDDDLAAAMRDVRVAVYLVHSIGEGDDWVEREERQARNFGDAAAAAGVERIVYLGGLGDDSDRLSPHLASRQRVGSALGAGGVPVLELRAGVIIGSGSASFEMLRYLVDVLPIMVTPKWVSTRCQPVAIANVVELLAEAITTDRIVSGVLEVGGADVVTYAEMMEVYAECAGLRRRVLLPVPLLSPRLSSHWIGLVTPVPVPLASELVESLVNEVVVTGRPACEELSVEPMGLREAITRALTVTRSASVPTTFSDADLFHFRPNQLDPGWAGGRVYTDHRELRSTASLEALFAELSTIGGERGWYGGEFLWRVRGVLDQLIGGPGLRRGRKPVLRVGDALDFWRIEELEPPRRLRLRAEMLLPGNAWLEWDIAPAGEGSVITQNATFRPRGVLGRAYWYAVAPFHGFVFPTMLRRIVGAAETRPT